jgi:hypothetical protein
MSGMHKSEAIISSHADYRRSDYMFAREQSRTLASMEWEGRESPLHSWAEILPTALGIATAAIALLETIH